jgi:hypothetical protein
MLGEINLRALVPIQLQLTEFFTYLWHLQITKLVPQILNGVETNERGDEETNPFNAANASN